MGYGDRYIAPALAQPVECGGCLLHGRSRGFALPEGTGRNGVICLAERLGKHEVEDGLPLRPQGAAGSIFERLLKQLGLERAEFKLVNLLNCEIPDKELRWQPYEFPAIEHCRVHRDPVLLNMSDSDVTYKQKVILAMGDIATRTLTGFMGKEHGIDKLRGYPVETPYGVVVPTYNPAKIYRDAKLLSVLKYDIQYAVNIAQQGWHPPQQHYLEQPTIEQARAFYEEARALCADGKQPVIAFDIENDFDPAGRWVRLTSVQFSLARNTGIFLDRSPQFDEVIRKLFGLNAEFWAHNGWRHDFPILTRSTFYSDGVKWEVVEPTLYTFGGPVHDSLWAFHHAQPDLTTQENEGDGIGISSKMGLQYVASLYGFPRRWKHLMHQNLRYYGVCDVDALQYIVPPLVEQLKAKGMWQSYLDHVHRYDPILQRVTERGIPVDNIKRVAVRADLMKELEKVAEEIQRIHPDELKNIDPPQGYTRAPVLKEGKIRNAGGISTGTDVYEWFDDEDKIWRRMDYRLFAGLDIKKKVECDCFTVVTHAPDKVNRKGVAVAGKPYKKAKKVYNSACERCAGKKTYSVSTTEEYRWVKVLPFKTSKDQIVRYMNFRNHDVPRKKKSDGSRGDTTDYKELEKLAIKYKDRLYTAIVECRKLEKLIITYIDGWAPQPDGRVHSVFLGSTATAQLAAERPNALNPPKHNEMLANKFRSMIIAPPGHSFIEMDFKSYHGATLAAESGDEVYYKIAVKVGDAHSFLASYLVKEPIDPSLSVEELKERCAYIKKKHKQVRNTSAKQANLGYGFGMQGPGLYERYAEYFESRACRLHSIGKCGHACEVISMLDRLYAKNKQWRDSQVEEAFNNGGRNGSGFLISKFNHIRWFPSIYAYRRNECVHCNGQEGYNMQCWMCHGKGNYWQRRNGSNLEDMYAFKPANHAHAAFRELQVRLDDRGLLDRYNFILPYHDALYLCCPDELIDEAIPTVYAEMVKPIMRLANPLLCPNGLIVDVDTNVGKSWDKMNNVKVEAA